MPFVLVDLILGKLRFAHDHLMEYQAVLELYLLHYYSVSLPIR